MYSDNERELERDLEAALKQAALEPSYRLQFYRKLIQAKIYVLGTVVNGEVDKKLALVSWKNADDNPVVPIFSSLAQLQKSIREQCDYVRLEASVFLQQTIGQTLILNPMSDYSKELLPTEIQALLDGSLFETVRPVSVEKGQKLIIGQPKTYPQELIEKLKELFQRYNSLESAYLAQIYDPAGTDAKPHLLIAIKGNGDFSRLFEDAGFVARSIDAGNSCIDFCVVNEVAELSEYFAEIEPFYHRVQYKSVFRNILRKFMGRNKK